MLKEVFMLLVERPGFFANLALEHLIISFISISIAGILGLLLGIAISEYARSAKPTLSIINIFYTIPSIALLGFLIPFSGIGNTTAIIALSIYALLPMVRSTYTGITNIDKNILEAAAGMGSTKWQILTLIKLPLAFPVIVSAIRNMVTMTIALTGIATFIGAGGLGVAIYRGIAMNDTAMILAGSLLIAILALIMDWLLGLLEVKSKARGKKLKWSTVRNIFLLLLALILISGSIFYAQKSKKIIRIATKPGTEQYLIAQMLSMAIEHETDLEVKLTYGIGGGTSNIQPAMLKGEFDLYPEYTGTAWNVVLKGDGTYQENKFDSIQKYYTSHYDMSWVGMYGFNNTFALAVRKELAEQYNLSTCSDLAEIAPTLVFGAEYDYFERQDGYKAFCDVYNFRFKKAIDMDMGLKYPAINGGKIDAMNVFTTDGLIRVSNIKILRDDRYFFPSYRCGNIVRNETLRQHPELRLVLTKFDNTITEEDMSRMNYQVEYEGLDPKKVAKDFLLKSGILKK